MSKAQHIPLPDANNPTQVNIDELLELPEADEPQGSYPTPGSIATAAMESITPAPAAPSLNVVSGPIMARRGIWDPMASYRQPLIDAGRAEAMRNLQALPEDTRAQYTIRVNQTTGRWYLARKPLAIQRDPYVKEMGARIAEVDSKISALEGDLTERQRNIITKLKERATQYVKGKKKGLPRPQISAKALDRVVFRALEMQASRRKAQLGAQERAARKQRHDLVGKKRTVALPNGQRVGYNMRAAKKAASSALINDNLAPLKQAAKADRDARTALNKQRRVSYAQARNNKINPKDLPAGTRVTYQPFRGDIPEGFVVGRGVTQIPVQ